MELDQIHDVTDDGAATAGEHPTAVVRRWTATSRAASCAVAGWAILLQIVARQVIPVVIAVGAVFGLLAIFLNGARRTLTMIAGCLAVLAIAGNLSGILDDLTHPSSGVAFSFTLWTTLAAAIVVVSGIGALLHWTASPAVPLATAGVALVGGLVVAVVATSRVQSDDAQPDDIAIVARQIEFQPDSVAVSAGETGFWVDNQDGIRHTFTIEGTTFELDVPGYSSKRAIADLEPGIYQVICDVPGHENMTLDLIVG